MKKFTILKRRIRDFIAYWRILSVHESDCRYKAIRLEADDQKDLHDAKLLHTSVYLAKGFLDESDVKDDIINELSDPHQMHAQYFVVKKNQEIVAVARQIIYKGQGFHNESFPILQKAIIYERSRRRILAHYPEEIVEISALAKKKGESSVVPLILYRELWRHSLSSKHRVWVMACDARLYERLKLLFGPAMTRIGKRTSYKGGDVMPAAIDIARYAKYACKTIKSRRHDIIDLKRKVAKFMIGEGLK